MSLHPYWIVLAITFLVIGEWETRARWRPLSVREKRRWLGHSALTGLGLALTWAVARVIPVAVAAQVARSPYGLLNRPWLPEPLAWILALLLLDLARYAMHYAHHRIPVLWRLHKVHHSDPDVDLSTGLRTHPLDSLILLAGHLTAIALLAPPAGAVVLVECLFAFQTLFTHANARLPEWIETRLRRFVVTPDMHRIHHSSREEEQAGNFGDVLPWWDRLFRTYIAAPEGDAAALVPGLRGLRTGDDRLSLRFMLSLPFRSEGDFSETRDRQVQVERQ